MAAFAPNNQPFPTWSIIPGPIKEPAHQQKTIEKEDEEGFDPISREKENVFDYLKKNKQENKQEDELDDNIAILYNNQIYLSKRSYIKQQYNEAIVFECLEAVTEKKITRPNVVINRPYYNLKKIGIVILPEYIHLHGINVMLGTVADPKDPTKLHPNAYDNFFTIIPGDKTLASVISRKEANQIPEDPNAQTIGLSNSACQVGQNGLTGFMVKGFMEKGFMKKKEKNPNVVGGKKWKKINKKTKITIKKSKKYNKNKQNNKKYTKRRTLKVYKD